MSEEKLTVAELMARAAKEGHTSDTPRRRRRRSLEDGGVSVAELTGSIPAVKEKPVEAKHSAVPIDAPATPEVPEQPGPAASTTPEEPQALPEPETKHRKQSRNRRRRSPRPRPPPVRCRAMMRRWCSASSMRRTRSG